MSEQERMSAAEYRALFTGNAPTTSVGRKSSKQSRMPKIKGLKKPPRDDTPTAILDRILRKLSVKNFRLQPEEKLAVEFADTLRELTRSGLLRAVWTHPANEIAGRKSGLSAIRYTIAKRMGLIDGAADYLFMWEDGSGALEAKIGSNKQQHNQLDFEWWCQQNGVNYAVFRTVEEGLAKLREWGALKTPGKEK